jgi:hypothetical protein
VQIFGPGLLVQQMLLFENYKLVSIQGFSIAECALVPEFEDPVTKVLLQNFSDIPMVFWQIESVNCFMHCFSVAPPSSLNMILT